MSVCSFELVIRIVSVFTLKPILLGADTADAQPHIIEAIMAIP
jgi:hypothetical protein